MEITTRVAVPIQQYMLWGRQGKEMEGERAGRPAPLHVAETAPTSSSPTGPWLHGIRGKWPAAGPGETATATATAKYVAMTRAGRAATQWVDSAGSCIRSANLCSARREQDSPATRRRRRRRRLAAACNLQQHGPGCFVVAALHAAGGPRLDLQVSEAH